MERPGGEKVDGVEARPRGGQGDPARDGDRPRRPSAPGPEKEEPQEDRGSHLEHAQDDPFEDDHVPRRVQHPRPRGLRIEPREEEARRSPADPEPREEGQEGEGTGQDRPQLPQRRAGAPPEDALGDPPGPQGAEEEQALVLGPRRAPRGEPRREEPGAAPRGTPPVQGEGDQRGEDEECQRDVGVLGRGLEEELRGPEEEDPREEPRGAAPELRRTGDQQGHRPRGEEEGRQRGDGGGPGRGSRPDPGDRSRQEEGVFGIGPSQAGRQGVDPPLTAPCEEPRLEVPHGPGVPGALRGPDRGRQEERGGAQGQPREDRGQHGRGGRGRRAARLRWNGGGLRAAPGEEEGEDRQGREEDRFEDGVDRSRGTRNQHRGPVERRRDREPGADGEGKPEEPPLRAADPREPAEPEVGGGHGEEQAEDGEHVHGPLRRKRRRPSPRSLSRTSPRSRIREAGGGRRNRPRTRGWYAPLATRTGASAYWVWYRAAVSRSPPPPSSR